jgi:hypothetical protein
VLTVILSVAKDQVVLSNVICSKDVEHRDVILRYAQDDSEAPGAHQIIRDRPLGWRARGSPIVTGRHNALRCSEPSLCLAEG